MTAWEHITGLAEGIGGGVAAVTAAAWLLRTWLGRKIQHQVEDAYKAKEQERQAAYDRTLADHRSKLSQELEGWKAGYQKAIDENRIRFSKLHEERATAIKRLFFHLANLEIATQCYAAEILQHCTADEQCKKRVEKALTEFAGFFGENRIFFTENDCKLIERITAAVQTGYFGSMNPMDSHEFRQAMTAIKDNVPDLRRTLERDFRTAIGLGER